MLDKIELLQQRVVYFDAEYQQAENAAIRDDMKNKKHMTQRELKEAKQQLRSLRAAARRQKKRREKVKQKWNDAVQVMQENGIDLDMKAIRTGESGRRSLEEEYAGFEQWLIDYMHSSVSSLR